MKNISFYIFAAIFLLPVFNNHDSNSQITQSWVQRYNYTSNYWDVSFRLTTDKFGSVYVTGYSYESTTNRNLITIKYNSSGAQEWAQRYGSGTAYGIAVDDSSNVYITGVSTENSNANIATVKYNASGIMQWAAAYNGTANGMEEGMDLAIDKANNVYVTGYSNGDIITIKYNNLGIQQWTALYADSIDYGRGKSIIIDTSGNVYVTGRSNGNITTIKYNSAGAQQWVSLYGTPGEGYEIRLDKLSNLYVTGSVYTGSYEDFVTIKYNSSGVQQWAKVINGSGIASGGASWMELDFAGNVFVTCSSDGGITSSDDYAIIKYSSSGVQEWISRYNGPGSGADYVRSIALDRIGDVYVTGYSVVPTGGTFDFATVKYNGITGAQQWVKLYNGTGDSSDYGWAIAVDSMYNVYVTGASFGNGTGRDIATIKYSQPIGIQQISNQVPVSYNLEQNYPNPFNPVTKIKFQIPQDEFVKLKIFDVIGREVSVPVNEKLAAGTYEVNWDAGVYSSGIYFYTLITSGYINTRKMIVVK